MNTIIGASDAKGIASLRQNRPADRAIIESLAQLYAAGCTLDFTAVDTGHTRRKISLPSYPFQRQRYWVDVEPKSHVGTSATLQLLGDGKLDELAEQLGLGKENGSTKIICRRCQ